LPVRSCSHCGETGERLVTEGPNDGRTDRRVELCAGCRTYLKSVDVAALSPFPLLAIADLETMDLDLTAMERGYARPALKDFGRRSLWFRVFSFQFSVFSFQF
jgi:FdhE protein